MVVVVVVVAVVVVFSGHSKHPSHRFVQVHFLFQIAGCLVHHFLQLGHCGQAPQDLNVASSRHNLAHEEPLEAHQLSHVWTTFVGRVIRNLVVVPIAVVTPGVPGLDVVARHLACSVLSLSLQHGCFSGSIPSHGPDPASGLVGVVVGAAAVVGAVVGEAPHEACRFAKSLDAEAGDAGGSVSHVSSVYPSTVAAAFSLTESSAQPLLPAAGCCSLPDPLSQLVASYPNSPAAVC